MSSLVSHKVLSTVGVGVALASPAAAAITSCQRRIKGVDDTPAAPWNLRGSCVHPHHPGTLSGLLPTLNPSHERKQALLYLGLWGHQTTLLAHRQALQVDYSFSCLLLASFNGSTFSCTLPRENEFTWPIFSHRDLSPFGIQVSWGSLSEEPVSELCSFPHVGSEQQCLAAFLILSSSRSPASLLRNFQTVLTWPANPARSYLPVSPVSYRSSSPSLTTLQ